MKKMLCMLLCAAQLFVGVCAVAESPVDVADVKSSGLLAQITGNGQASQASGNLLDQFAGAGQEEQNGQNEQEEQELSIFDQGYAAYNAGDYAAALNLWMTAAQDGSSAAMHNLGVMYEKGQGTQQDYVQAAQWYQRAAEAGYALGMMRTGYMYCDGKGVEKDYAQGAYWLELALANGITENGVYEWLGYLYGHDVEGVQRDYAKAVGYYMKAMDQGSGYAMLRIGEMYDIGAYFEEDDQKALEYYNMALAAGEESAQAAIDALTAE